jgi:hypothetical protein
MSLLPGMFPAAVAARAAAPAVLTTLTQVASATSTGTNITGPAGIQAGDLLVLVDRAIGAGVPTAVVPSGFASVSDSNNGSNTQQILSSKIADGSEASASLTGMTSSISQVAKVLLVFRGNVAIAAATAQDVGAQSTTGNPTAQVVNASGGAAPLVVIGAYGSQGAINPRSMSPAKDGEVGEEGPTSAKTWLAWKIYDTSPADVTVDMDDEDGGGTSGNTLQSCYLACS